MDSKSLGESNVYAIVSSLYLSLLKITLFLHIITALITKMQCVILKMILGWEKSSHKGPQTRYKRQKRLARLCDFFIFTLDKELHFPHSPKKSLCSPKEQRYCLKVSKPSRCFAGVETGKERAERPSFLLGKELVRTTPVGSPPAYRVDPPGRGHAGPVPHRIAQATSSTQHHPYLLNMCWS